MDEIHIPNDATYSPIALTDLITAAPLASRLLLGATLPGRVLSAAAMGVYAGSALKDWTRRRDVRWVNFEEEFGADIKRLDPMPTTDRHDEVRRLAARLDREFHAEHRDRDVVAREANRHLTRYIASVTGQTVHTSSEVRDFTIAKLIFPFAMGVCDIISGDVAIFKDTGVLEPHVICHEFVHRKGYWKELHAQVLSYFALVSSGDPAFVQAALAERLHRQLKVLNRDDHEAYHDMVDGLGMRDELDRQFHALSPDPSAYEGTVSTVMKNLYDQRMKLTGQNGLSDYDEGFTNFLWTFSRSVGVGQDPKIAEI